MCARVAVVCTGVKFGVCWSGAWCVLEWGLLCAGVGHGVCCSGAWCVLE